MTDFPQLASMVRNNRVKELEAIVDDFESKVSLDQEEEGTGNTLLIVACQNGNKRICKILLRRGASINKRTKSGNSCLHFCFAFGFRELGEYLIEKGADESMRNVDGLTCYEGLSGESLKDL